MTAHKAFVCGATGVQGGAVARQLRAVGWDVNTITRDADSSAAKQLTSIGVKVFPGTWQDLAALEAAITGCDALFLNLQPDFTNPASELEDGKNILAVAKRAGVKHLLYSSGYLPSDYEKEPVMKVNFQSKKAVEKIVADAGFQYWTVQRPGFFMANFFAPKVNMLYPGAAEKGLFAVAFHPHSLIPMIDHEDIGAYAVAAFQNPEKFHAQHMDVLSELVSVEAAMETMRRVSGRNIRAEYLSGEELELAKQSNVMLVFQEVMRDSTPEFAALGCKGDVKAEARKWGVETGSFERFVEREKKAFEETYANV